MASEDLVLYCIIGAITVIALYIIWSERRMQRFLRGKDAKSIEDSVINLISELDNLKNEYGETKARLGHMDKRVGRSIQKIETVRFNAFADAGGAQSFATALLDEHGNGVVLSTLYSRDRVSMFSKPINEFVSQYSLSPEETEAIQRTRLDSSDEAETRQTRLESKTDPS